MQEEGGDLWGLESAACKKLNGCLYDCNGGPKSGPKG